MSDITSILEAGGTIATVGDTAGITVSAVQTSVPSNSIENMTDVDLQNLEGGSILIYKNATSMWTASRLLDQQNLEGGNY
jgi:hypothetical protein